MPKNAGSQPFSKNVTVRPLINRTSTKRAEHYWGGLGRGEAAGTYPSITAPSAAGLQSPSVLSDTAPVAALTTLRTINPRERFREIAQLGIQAAEALHYAHEMGIVHRDIKPSNLLVDAQGHLWITDFGLATTQTDAGLTMTGDLLGTLRYMSPEQAAGDRARIDYRTDIYSLGITLYELLTGQPAFADTDRKLLLRRILEDNPIPLRAIDPSLPRDLETIVLKAIEKEPHARYDSAGELAADLGRFYEEKPIHARRTSRAERLWRWGKRNRLVAALSIIVASLTALVAITAPLIAWRQTRLVNETRQQLYAKDVSIAYNAWNDGDLGHARVLLDRYAVGSPYAHLRDFPWYYLDGLYQRATAGFMPGGTFDVSLTSKLLAVARSDDLIHLHDVESWNQVGTLPLPWKNQATSDLRFSPDGRFLVAGTCYGRLVVWDVSARSQLYTITIGNRISNVYSPVFSPDGSILATGGPDAVVRLWEPTTGKLHRVLTGHRDDVSALAFSPDGNTLATASYDHSLRLWDTDICTLRDVIEGAFGPRVQELAYDPTGTRIAAGGYAEEITILDASGKEIASLPGTGSSVCFSPDGRLLAVGGAVQGTVDVWDVDEQRLVNHLLLGQGGVSVAFLPSAELIIGADDRLMRRDPRNQAEAVANQLTDTSTEEVAIDVSASGNLMVAAYGRYEADPGEGAVTFWDLRRGKGRSLPGLDGSSVFDVAIDRAGELMVAGGGPRYGPGFVKLWNAQTGTLTAELPNEEICVNGVSLSPTGDRLAVVASRRVSLWRNLTGKPELLWQRKAGRTTHIAFSPRGNLLAVGYFGGDESEVDPPAVMIWDAETGDQLEIASSKRAIMDLAFSPDGRYLASIDWSGIVEVYDMDEQRTVLSERAHPPIGYSVAFSPDGRTLATASANRQIKFWHVPTMMHVTTLETRARVAELAFFPDGQTLAVGYLDRTVELLHVNDDKEQFSIDDPVQ